MESTVKLNQFQCASSAKMVSARFVVSVPIPVVENGHSRSLPAEIDGTIISPRFRSDKADELPVPIKSSFVSSEPAREPIPDPTLGTVLPGE